MLPIFNIRRFLLTRTCPDLSLCYSLIFLPCDAPMLFNSLTLGVASTYKNDLLMRLNDLNPAIKPEGKLPPKPISVAALKAV